MSNGEMQQQQPGLPQNQPPLGHDTPIAYYTPVPITPGTVKWFFGAIVGIMGVLATSPIAERWMMPAKDSDLQQVRAIVETLRAEQEKSREAISRLTLAVDNLSGIVNSMKLATASITKARR